LKSEKKTSQPFRYNEEPENNSSLSRKAVTSGIFVTISKVFRYGYGFIAHLILLNFLSPADFGLMKYVIIVLGFINLINDAGFKLAIVQKKHIDKQEVFSSFLLSIVFGSGFYLAIFTIAPVIAYFTGSQEIVPLLRVGGIAAFTGGASMVQRGLMQRQFRFARLSLIDVLSAVTGSSVGIALALNGKGVWALVLTIVIYNALVFCLCTFASGMEFRGDFNFRSTFALVAFGFKDIISKFIGYFSVNIDSLIIGRIFGEQVLGIYGFAFSLMLAVNTAFGIIFNDISISLFSRLQGDPQRLRTLFLKMTEAVVLVSVPYCILLVFSGPNIIDAISFFKNDQRWVPAIPYLIWLAPTGLFYTFAGFPIMVWIAKGFNGLRIWWQVLSLVTVIITILIGAHFGPVQVGLALLIRAIIMLPVSVFVNYKYTGVTPADHLHVLIAPILCGVAATVSLLGLHSVSFLKGIGFGWQWLCIDLCVVFLVYTGSLWLFFRSIFGDLEKLISLTGLKLVNPFRSKVQGS
jgi:PST family polysaccharide transporter